MQNIPFDQEENTLEKLHGYFESLLYPCGANTSLIYVFSIVFHENIICLAIIVLILTFLNKSWEIIL